MKIQINESGILKIDENEKKIVDLDSVFLEKLVNDSLEGLVDYEILGETPIANFFKQIQNETSSESDLKKAIDNIKKDSKDLLIEQEKLIPNYSL